MVTAIEADSPQNLEEESPADNVNADRGGVTIMLTTVEADSPQNPVEGSHAGNSDARLPSQTRVGVTN